MRIKYSNRILQAIIFALIFCSGQAFGQPSKSNETSAASSSENKTGYWQQQRKGANGDAPGNANEWFKAAAEAGLSFVRLTPAKWKGQQRDFLIGNADNFTNIPEKDLARLKQVLDTAQKNQVRVVLTMFSLPGARWRQQNNNAFDYRLWTDDAYQQQAFDFWKQLAKALKNHPAIAGYNPINEPYPARKDNFTEESHAGFEKWLKEHTGTACDLNRFNRGIVKAIRSQDPDTPIILDGWFHAGAAGVPFLTPVNDKAVLYAFHFYDPWDYTTFRVNKGRFSYPDKMPGDNAGKTKAWSRKTIEQKIQPVAEWAKRFNIPASGIIVEEFGCDRRVSGAQSYLENLMAVFNKKGWHWAFYAFRSSDWDGMDYELGTKKLNWKYWEKRDKGVPHEQLIERKDNPLWNVFRREFAK